MPTLKQITCSIELPQSRTKLNEYGARYSDGHVECFVPVHDDPRVPFSVHVESEGYIAPGLAVFIFMDGEYQCNRNRRRLKMPEEGVEPKQYQIDFTFRQKEEKKAGGGFVGRNWYFAQLNKNSASPLNPSFMHNVGTIEVVVLRCKNPPDDAIPRMIQSKPADRNSDKQVARVASRHSRSGSAVTKVASAQSSEMGQMHGLFDGAGDEPDHFAPAINYRPVGQDGFIKPSPYDNKIFDEVQGQYRGVPYPDRMPQQFQQHAPAVQHPAPMVQTAAQPDQGGEKNSVASLKTNESREARSELCKPNKNNVQVDGHSGYPQVVINNAWDGHAQNDRPVDAYYGLRGEARKEQRAMLRDQGYPVSDSPSPRHVSFPQGTMPASPRSERTSYSLGPDQDGLPGPADPLVKWRVEGDVTTLNSEEGPAVLEAIEQVLRDLTIQLRAVDAITARNTDVNMAQPLLEKQLQIRQRFQAYEDAKGQLLRGLATDKALQLAAENHEEATRQPTPQQAQNAAADGWHATGQGMVGGNQQQNFAQAPAVPAPMHQQQYNRTTDGFQQTGQGMVGGNTQPYLQGHMPANNVVVTNQVRSDSRGGDGANSVTSPDHFDQQQGQGKAPSNGGWGNNGQQSKNNDGWGASSPPQGGDDWGNGSRKNNGGNWGNGSQKNNGGNCGNQDDNRSNASNRSRNSGKFSQDGSNNNGGGGGWPSDNPQQNGHADPWANNSPKQPSHKSDSSHRQSESGSVNGDAKVKPYWEAWRGGSTTPHESSDPNTKKKREIARSVYAYPEEALPQVLAGKADSVSHGVQAGKGADYVHRKGRPEYIDTMSKPYAVFSFKYRSIPKLEKLLKRDISIDVKPVNEQAEKDRLQSMPKHKLIEELIKARGQTPTSAKSSPAKGASSWAKPSSDKAASDNWGAKPAQSQKPASNWGAQSADKKQSGGSNGGWGGNQNTGDNWGAKPTPSQRPASNWGAQSADKKQSGGSNGGWGGNQNAGDNWGGNGNGGWDGANNKSSHGQSDDNGGKSQAGGDANDAFNQGPQNAEFNDNFNNANAVEPTGKAAHDISPTADAKVAQWDTTAAAPPQAWGWDGGHESKPDGQYYEPSPRRPYNDVDLMNPQFNNAAYNYVPAQADAMVPGAYNGNPVPFQISPQHAHLFPGGQLYNQNPHVVHDLDPRDAITERSDNNNRTLDLRSATTLTTPDTAYKAAMNAHARENGEEEPFPEPVPNADVLW